MSSIIRAIDVGYGNTKYTTGHDDNGICCGIMPSLAVKESQRHLTVGLKDKRDTQLVTVNGSKLEVGTDVTTLIDLHQSHPLHSQYSESDAYTALHYGALLKMDVSHIDLLVLGLPVHLLNTRSAVLKNKFLGDIQINDDTSITIDMVSVVAQPMGGYVHYVNQNALSGKPAFKKQKTLIIDPGYYTFDWLVAEGYSPLEQFSGAHEGGMSAILKNIASEIEQDKKINPQLLPYKNLAEIDLGMRTGKFHLYGQSINLNDYISEANKYAKSVFDVLINEAGHGHDIEKIVLVGGAAAYFKHAAEYYFPNHNVHIMPNSIFANVRGFQLLGEAFSVNRSGEVT